MKLFTCLLLAGALLVASVVIAADAVPEPLSPADSMKAVKLPAGLQLQLVAAEPQVMDPIAIAWGYDGKLWVVEMGDYPLGVGPLGAGPLGPEGANKPGGRVRFLEDTDGDGRFEKSTLFLDSLGYPTGVMPWRKGVLVTCAPDLFYAEDTDGDGRADKREVLYTGFGEGNQQHRVNGLRWGVDNWVYVANGDGGAAAPSMVKSLKTGETLDLRGHDLRIDPATGRHELVTGPTQFGLNCDDFGHWFGSNNAQPMYHFVLGDHYLRRNPLLTPPNPRVQISVAPGAARVFPASAEIAVRPGARAAGAPGYFSSASSAMIHRDDLLGTQYLNNAFICDPTNNLIHREVVTPAGVTFSSRRADDELEAEFYASADGWSRPTMIRTGPDGALWVVDMYRLVIEHPQWIDANILKQRDVRSGHDKGRIYRIVRTAADGSPAPLRKVPRFDRLSTDELVDVLQSPNATQRELVQQLIVARGDKAAVQRLEMLAIGGHRATTRMQALGTLEGLKTLSSDVLARGLIDLHAGVRRQVVRMCEQAVARDPALGEQLIKLAADPDAAVRLQLACSLGEWDDPRAAATLADLAIRDHDNPYIVAGVLSSVQDRNLDAFLASLLNRKTPAPLPAGILTTLAEMALQSERGLTPLTEMLPRDDAALTPQQAEVAIGLMKALARKEKQTQAASAVEISLLELVKQARSVATNAERKTEERQLAIELLGWMPATADDLTALETLTKPQSEESLQTAAVTALLRLDGAASREALLQAWSSVGPAVRMQIFDGLLSRSESAHALVKAIEAKQVLAAHLDASARQRLLRHADQSVKKAAEQVLVGQIDADRQKVVESYRSALELTGDAMRGAAVFKQRCAVCHRLGEVGTAVGPDLAPFSQKPAETVLVAMFDPNRAVEARYVTYQAITSNGQSFTGVLGADTGGSITLIAQEGKVQSIARSDLEELIGTGKSLMPEGLEKDIAPQAVADLLAYVRGFASQPTGDSAGGSSPKSIAGNKPELVRPTAQGALRLLATNGEIYGDRVGLNQEARCIAWMAAPDDRVVWTIEAPRAGRYDVQIEWAQIDDNAGNKFSLALNKQKLTGTFASTGDWAKYRRASFGTLELPAGRSQITLQPVGEVKSELADLREIQLVPK